MTGWETQVTSDAATANQAADIDKDSDGSAPNSIITSARSCPMSNVQCQAYITQVNIPSRPWTLTASTPPRQDVHALTATARLCWPPILR